VQRGCKKTLATAVKSANAVSFAASAGLDGAVAANKIVRSVAARTRMVFRFPWVRFGAVCKLRLGLAQDVRADLGETVSRSDAQGLYEVSQRRTVAEVPGLRVRELTLAPDQCVPWHSHTRISDTFFCMEGPMVVRTRAPDTEQVLRPGETTAVGPGVVHRVSGLDDGRCRFMIVQGVGTYDYVACDV